MLAGIGGKKKIMKISENEENLVSLFFLCSYFKAKTENRTPSQAVVTSHWAIVAVIMAQLHSEWVLLLHISNKNKKPGEAASTLLPSQLRRAHHDYRAKACSYSLHRACVTWASPFVDFKATAPVSSCIFWNVLGCAVLSRNARISNSDRKLLLSVQPSRIPATEKSTIKLDLELLGKWVLPQR